MRILIIFEYFVKITIFYFLAENYDFYFLKLWREILARGEAATENRENAERVAGGD